MGVFDGMLQRRHMGPVFGGLNIKILAFLGTSLAVLLFAAMFAPGLCPALWEVSDLPRKANALAAGDPVAVISPLPDEVSNGTWWNLNGNGSTDSDGLITNFTWSITVAGTTSHLYGKREEFKFRTLGLYKIVLIVRDNDDKTASAFTAVYSIIDLDGDGMPDWWEIKYFLFLSESGSDDYDRDGYTNLQEYASHTDPTAKDPQPGPVQFVKDNWILLAIIAAVIVGAILLILPRMKRRRKRDEKAKIEFAIEIEKALQGEK
jgi:hypothetical protein